MFVLEIEIWHFVILLGSAGYILFIFMLVAVFLEFEPDVFLFFDTVVNLLAVGGVHYLGDLLTNLRCTQAAVDVEIIALSPLSSLKRMGRFYRPHILQLCKRWAMIATLLTVNELII